MMRNGFPDEYDFSDTDCPHSIDVTPRVIALGVVWSVFCGVVGAIAVALVTA